MARIQHTLGVFAKFPVAGTWLLNFFIIKTLLGNQCGLARLALDPANQAGSQCLERGLRPICTFLLLAQIVVLE